MPRILILDDIAPEGIDLLEAADDVEHEIQTGLDGEDLRLALATCDGTICRSGVTIGEEHLAGNRQLKVIVRAGVGTDNIDKAAATRAGIVVMNTPAGNTFSTAEHTFTLMLAMCRNVAPAYQSLIEGSWDRTSYMGCQLAHKTIGIVGLGRIGQEVARRAAAFQMKIIGIDPFLAQEQAEKLGIELALSLDELLPRVDFLTVHTPLTEETRNLVSHEQVDKLKPGARLINCARGGIYDEEALADGLESGKLAGVALDVFSTEPCTESRLFGMPGVICTPHLGATTREAQTQVSQEAVELLLNYLRTGEIRHAVNMASIDLATLASLSGYLDLAYRLGLFASQWLATGLASCQLDYRGEVANLDTRLLTAAFASGLLERALDEDVNIVNSELLLRERGIQLVEQSQLEMGDFSSSITAQLDTDGDAFAVAGTLFGQSMPRLIRLGEYRLETYLDGVMLVFSHHDVPGIIGWVGSILGEEKVNIAQMSVGRAGDAPGGQAIGVLNLDTVPPQQALEKLQDHEDIERVQVIQLPIAGKLPDWLVHSLQ
jgi:D-3-phosphoglycerate dehydrogenase